MTTSSSMDRYIANICGKVAIVTGAASGLGKQLSKALAENQLKVLLVDIDPKVEQVSNELNEQHHNTSWIVLDLCERGSIQKFFDKAIDKFGHIDIVVNNAGIANERSLFSQEDHKELDRIIDINLRAPMEATRLAVRYFRETGIRGTVLNTASVGGLMPISLMESYGSTKAGIIFFTASCKALAPQVRVNAVAPYFTDTPLVANNRLVQAYPLVQKIGLMKPEKVIKTMIKALGDESLAGDTLMISMGAKAEKLKFYDGLTLQVIAYIAGGTVNKYAASISSYFSGMLNSILGFLRNPVPVNIKRE
ncbi:hypothetical protein LPJ66_000983 [Kickxella alabastrina]|uniref:Uncharacterized protein n=1 Tax=Kickxella alabastrina TaxID=61397 RepID=A0ACC1IUL0_9FUNG|nr:hypothetical protein LPJ66_000983 [Kickxella alabastrina]